MLWLNVEIALILSLVTRSLTTAQETVTTHEGALKRFERDLKTTVCRVFGDLDSVFKRLLDVPMFNSVQQKDSADSFPLFGDSGKYDGRTYDVKTERLKEMNEIATTTCWMHRWEVEPYKGFTTRPEFKAEGDARSKRRMSRSKRMLDSDDMIIEDDHPYVVSIHSKLDKSYIQTGVALSHTVVGTPAIGLHDHQGNPYKAADLIVTTHTPDGRADKELPVTQIITGPGSNRVDALLDETSSSDSPVVFLETQGSLDHIIASDLIETSRKLSSSSLPKSCRVMGWRKVEESGQFNAPADATVTPSTTKLEFKMSHLMLSKPTKCAAHLHNFNVSKELCSVRRKTRTTDWFDDGDGLLICSGKLEGFVVPRRDCKDAKTSVTLFSRVIDSSDLGHVTSSLSQLIGAGDIMTASARTRWGPHLAAPTPLLIISLALIAFI